jgi:peptide/nickel transport system permease protein
VLVAPRVEPVAGGLRVGWATGEQTVPANAVRGLSHHRLWLGSDRLGADVARQVLAGGRTSLLIAVLAVLVALVAGCAVGLAAATGGRLVDGLLMRLVDALLAFPVLFLMILLAALTRPGPWLLVPVLGLTSWMGLARLVRGQVLSLRTRPFVLAARVAGSPWHRIWRWHYLRNMSGPVAQDLALRTGDLVLAEATLSFLGLGLPPTTASWGALVREGQRALVDGWWLTAFPGFAIALLVISLALIGDGLQDRTPSAG